MSDNYNLYDTTIKDNNYQIDKSKAKMKKTLNVSIQKRNLEDINLILNNWEDEGLNVSGEVCKSILFKYDLENNPYIQTLLSTLNLIKTNLKNKNTYEESQESALLLALKNIISIKINAQELSNFLENDLYFSSKDTNHIHNLEPSQNNDIKHSQIEQEIASDSEVNYKKESDKNKKNETQSKNTKHLKWDIPEKPTIPSLNNQKRESINNETEKNKKKSSQEDLLNQCLNGFSYNY